MIFRTVRAALQIEALLSHFHQQDRPEAAGRLLDAVHRAVRSIEARPDSGLPYPRPYRDIEEHGFRWLKVHRYWFGYTTIDGCLVITNVLYESADLPARVQAADRILPDPDDEPVD